MSGDLFLFPAGDGEGFGWARVTAGGDKVKTGWASASKDAPSGADRIVVLVPGEDVAAHSVALPARTEAQARAAAAFAIEDMIGQPLDEVHVAAGPRAQDSVMRTIVVVDRQRFAAWRGVLGAFDIAPDHIIPDYLAVPASADEVCVFDLGARVLVRGGGLGFAIEAELAREVLSECLARTEARVVRAWTNRPDALFSSAVRAECTVHVEAPLSDDDLARAFQRGVDDGLAADLANADTAPGAGFALDWRRWRVAAGLALAAGLGYAALLVTQIAALENETDTAYAEAEELLRDAFPDIGRVVNPRAQLRARLGDGGGGGRAFVALSGLVADSVRDIETLEVDSIRFDAAETELEVGIRYASYEDVERLRAAVDARGGLLEEGGSRRLGDLMGGDVIVRGAP